MHECTVKWKRQLDVQLQPCRSWQTRENYPKHGSAETCLIFLAKCIMCIQIVTHNLKENDNLPLHIHFMFHKYKYKYRLFVQILVQAV
jgi:hypothetical protein